MLAVLSPAKKLDFTPAPPALAHSEPPFLAEAGILAAHARTLGVGGLKRLMGLSDNLAEVNRQRFEAFAPPFTPDNAKQAVLAFAGDTYTGLDAGGLDVDDLTWAQDHLLILSGLFGVLRPLDLIQPYRLEMGCKLANPEGADLYAFWGGRIGPWIAQALGSHRNKTVVNLASAEYVKAVDEPTLPGDVVTPVFKVVRDGRLANPGMMVKRARGAMARFMIEERIDRPEGLLGFTWDGYAHRPDLSTKNAPTFVRNG